MGAAIGREIAKSVVIYEKKQSEEPCNTDMKKEIKIEKSENM